MMKKQVSLGSITVSFQEGKSFMKAQSIKPVSNQKPKPTMVGLTLAVTKAPWDSGLILT